MWGESAEHGAKFDGNSILLHIEGMKYVFIGEEIFSFTAQSRIMEFKSPVGNNDVPYPWAKDEEGLRYLLTMSVILSSKLFDSEEKANDPYELYFDRGLITPDIGFEPPQQPYKQFQGITAFFIGEEQFTLKHEPHPEEALERLNSMGDFYLVKGDDKKVKISNEEYVKLMRDFEDFSGFQPLSKEVLHERE